MRELMRFTVVVAATLAFAGATHAAQAAPTVVSLTFDDNDITQAVTPQMLAAHGMRATYFVNSGTVGKSGYLSWAQIAALAAAGHEIGGHTLDHLDLGSSATDKRWQICEDRARLLNRGFAVRNFAYPYGSGYTNSTVRSLLQECGYNSARRSWGLFDDGCTACSGLAETIPPADVYAIRTPDSPTSTTTLDKLKSYVTRAEQQGGGWVIFVLHRVCEGCDPTGYEISPGTFDQLLGWLEPRAPSGTVVKTVSDVIGGTVKPSPGTADGTTPSSSITCNGVACSTDPYSPPVQVRLSATDAGGSGLEAIRYTTDGTDPTLTSPVYSTPFTVSSTTSIKYRAWDNAGNAEATKSQSISIGIDTTPPNIVFTSPTDGATVSGTVQVQASASDAASGIASVTFYVDGEVAATSSSSPHKFPWNTRKVSKAQHVLRAVARDRAGNEASTSITVTVR